ncbi:MAG TPA: VOC family protein [Chitinispirillaceae bacterium]|nr:VOC family protein [Chitinispirillaceae bacterium]
MATQKNPVTWFEIPVTDIVRAKNFYEYVLGYQLSFQELKGMKMAEFPMNDGRGASGALVQSIGYTPQHSGTVVYFSVDDIGNTMSRVQQKGGKQLIPKTSIGEYGYIAHFEDSEGNQVALHSMH